MEEEEKLFTYFVTQTNERLSNIENKLDQLITFRMMLIGASIAISTIVSLIVTIYVKVY